MDTKIFVMLALVIMTLISSVQAVDVTVRSNTVVGNILYENTGLYSLICMLMAIVALMIWKPQYLIPYKYLFKL